MNSKSWTFATQAMACCAVFLVPWIVTQPCHGQVEAKPLSTINQDNLSADSESELNDKLADFLTGTRWEGQFTVTGKDGPPIKEHYEIITAEKAEQGDLWNLIARIKYGKNDTTLPLPPIEIKWAGRTPVITIDQVTIPGMGTFDARVLIRKSGDGGSYAGTWGHDDVRGHLFGTIGVIEKPIEEVNEEVEKDQPESKPDR